MTEQQKPRFPRRYPTLWIVLVVCGLLLFWAIHSSSTARLAWVEQHWTPDTCEVLERHDRVEASGDASVTLKVRPHGTSARYVTWRQRYANSGDARQQTRSLQEGQSLRCFVERGRKGKVPDPDEISIRFVDPYQDALWTLTGTRLMIVGLFGILIYLFYRRRAISRRSEHAFSDQPPWPKRRLRAALAVLLAWSGVVVVTAYGVWFHGGDVVLHGLDQERWRAQEGRVLRSRAYTTKGNKNSTHYHWEVRFAYEVNGREYVADQFRFRGDIPDSKSAVHALAEAYPKDKKVWVYVDPDDPTGAVMERSFPVRLFVALMLLWWLSVAIDPRLPWLRWAWRQLRPAGDEAVDPPPRQVGSFDLERWRRPVASAGEHRLSDGRILRWDVDAIQLDDQRLSWDGASLHLSRAEPAIEDTIEGAARHIFHLALRGRRGQLRLQTLLGSDDARLGGLPWLSRQGDAVSADIVGDVMALALLHELSVAGWSDEALIHPDERERRRRRSAQPLLLDSSQRSRERFFWHLRFAGVVLSVIAALMGSALQGYPDEALIGEVAFGCRLALLAAVLARPTWV